MPQQCFVVMGFGLKTDYATGRKLDLDKSYRLLIKPVVENKGISCIRADEIRHSGTIDLPMFQMLLQADIVIADLSTANLNVFYELGIRHALRPCTTIIISENKLPYPFDINHIKIESYTHLGDAIDYEEVERFRSVLGDTLETLLHTPCTDSPVYTFLQDLMPPVLQQKVTEVVREVTTTIANNDGNTLEGLSPKAAAPPKDPTLSIIVEQAEQAIKTKEFLKAKALFNSALLISGTQTGNNLLSNNAYLVQRLALSTYKARFPDEISALNEAFELLKKLDLDHTNDSETVALAGAIEKRMYECGEGVSHLSEAILYFQRGFYLLHNRYNGINLAFLLNYRADSALANTKEDQVADVVWANRIRNDVLAICKNDWQEIVDREGKNASLAGKFDLEAHQQSGFDEQKFWILANEAEAYFGLGEMKAYQQALEKAQAMEYEDWMMESLTNQIEKLKAMLEKQGYLLNPAWPQNPV